MRSILTNQPLRIADLEFSSKPFAIYHVVPSSIDQKDYASEYSSRQAHAETWPRHTAFEYNEHLRSMHELVHLWHVLSLSHEGYKVNRDVFTHVCLTKVDEWDTQQARLIEKRYRTTSICRPYASTDDQDVRVHRLAAMERGIERCRSPEQVDVE